MDIADPASERNGAGAGDDSRLDAATIKENARRLAPAIAERSAEIEALRRLPDDLVADLRAAGVFRMAMPHPCRPGRHGRFR